MINQNGWERPPSDRPHEFNNIKLLCNCELACPRFRFCEWLALAVYFLLLCVLFSFGAVFAISRTHTLSM